MKRIVLTAIAMLAVPVVAEDFIVSGTIRDFVCGDNCYLVIATPDDDEVTALCLADQCTPWIENGAMDPGLVGQSVIVNVGAGMQFDGEGTPMGPFPAFTEFRIGQ